LRLARCGQHELRHRIHRMSSLYDGRHRTSRLYYVDRHSQGECVPNDSRENMIRATVDLLRERGYAGTSLGDILARSGGPRGSISHHFPGGKQELVTEALRRYAAGIRRRLVSVAETGSAVDLVRALLGAMRDGLRASDFAVGCAVAGVVLDLSPDRQQ